MRAALGSCCRGTPLAASLSTDAVPVLLAAPTLQDAAGFVEKADLVAKVREVAAQGPEGEAPAGYVFDAATGYYLNSGESTACSAGLHAGCYAGRHTRPCGCCAGRHCHASRGPAASS